MKLAWLLLVCAIASELVGTTALKMSMGFTRPVPSLVVAIGYGLAFFLMSKVLKVLEVGVVYAIWSGAGLAIIALIGIVCFGETINLSKLLGLLSVLVGVVLLSLSSAGH